MDFYLDFLGAAGTVTGSRNLLRVGKSSYLIDCGLFQGSKELRAQNWEPFHPDPSKIEAIFLTHAHIDHSGYLPKLYKEGFRGKIYCTQGTFDLSRILLMDAAKLQEEDAAFANKTKHSRHQPALPLYTIDDAMSVLKHFEVIHAGTWFHIDHLFQVRFMRAGHIVGSSFIQFNFNSKSQDHILTFSGDIGHHRSLTIKGPSPINHSKVLILESTYGDRLHPREDSLLGLAKVIKPALERNGVVLIPAFAVGRTQEMLYHIRLLEDKNLIPKVPVVLDSPMAQSATHVFLKHYDDNKIEAEQFFPHHYTQSQNTDDSMLACLKPGPMIVISASGMLSGGRILHHLKARLPHPENLVLFVGYQAEGSKGRYLQENAKKLGNFRVHHQVIQVEAEIASLEHFSAHGDYQDLLEWLKTLENKPENIILNHGTTNASLAFAEKIEKELGIATTPLTRTQTLHFENF